jgi:phosphogluconate dehydratase
LNWDDFSDLSAVTPLLARVYPNGAADVNQFHVAGGMGFLIRQLLKGGLLHGDIATVFGDGLADYTREPWLSEDGLAWRALPEQSGDLNVLRALDEPFDAEGGLKLLTGNLGRAVIKTSAVKSEHRVVEAPAIVFDDQMEVIHAFKAGELARDFVAVVRYQGPRANGMPELHQLTPALSSLQSRGYHVALVTDGRMSGASGTVPAAIHVSPECLSGGPLAKVRTGDVIRLDSRAGILEARVAEEEWVRRGMERPDLSANAHGMGRELFAAFRTLAGEAETGALSCTAGY